MWCLPHVFGVSERLLDQIARVAPTHLNAARAEVSCQQILHESRIELQVAVAAEFFEDLSEISLRRAFAENLVMDAPQECFVYELRRLDVGGKHDQRHEWQVEFLPSLKREEIDTALEGNDPPIQQVSR